LLGSKRIYYVLSHIFSTTHTKGLPMPATLKLALVGCGAIARFHLDGIVKHAPRIRVTACIDPDLEKAQAYADETGSQAYSSLDEALQQGDFDAVDLMLPHDLHESIAIQCLRAGKHVL
jgi:predicted dehydrogenase